MAAPVAPRASAHVQDLTKVATGTGINFLGSVFRTGFTFIYAVFLAAFLDPGSVGLFFLGFTVLTLLGTAATLGLDTGVLRFTALYDGEGDQARVRGVMAGAVSVAVPVSMLIGGALFVLAEPVASDVFGKPELATVLKLFAPAVPLFAVAKLFNSGTQGLRHMQYQVYSRDIGEQTSKFVLSAGLLFLGLGLGGVVSANTGALVIALLLSFLFYHRLNPMFGSGLTRTYIQRRLLYYSLPLAASAMLALLLIWVDTLFLGYFRPAEDVGVYSIAMRLVKMGAMFNVAINTMFAPLASDFYNRGEHERLERLLKSVTKWIAALSFPVLIGMGLFSEQVLSLMGTHYTLGAAALGILVLGMLAESSTGPVANMLMMCGRPRVVLANNITVFVIDVVLCLVLIPRYGMIGAALASAITIALFNLGALGGVIFLLKLQPFSMGYAKIVGAGLVSVLVTVALQHLLPSSAAGLLVSLAAFIGTYSLLAFRSGFDSSDMQVASAFKAKLTRGR
jgi:O-antigen/teichoic acid export membrane protein